MSAVIEAKNLTKRYGKRTAVDGIDFTIPAGRIVGLIGPNGSGKTTTLKAALGLIPFEGQLSVLGLDPRTHRDELMQDVCFIADVAILLAPVPFLLQDYYTIKDVVYGLLIIGVIVLLPAGIAGGLKRAPRKPGTAPALKPEAAR